MAKRTTRKRPDHYQEITDRILKAMESGDVAPWQRPWKLSPYGRAPMNPASGTVYRGINVWLTRMTMWERGYDHPLFLTFKQANEMAAKALRAKGIKVEHRAVGRKAKDPKKQKKVWVFAEGENEGKSCGGIMAGQNQANNSGGTAVILWKRVNRVEEDEDGTERYFGNFFTRAYSVFNIAQCDEVVRDYVLTEPEPSKFSPLELCEQICDGYDVETRHGGDRAYYMPSEDRIQMPPRETFKTPEGYYTTRFHEMGHSTGHVSRLARDSMKPGKHREVHTYAEEELVAEFTACFLAGEAGIVRTTEGNAAAYLKHWASKLKEDKRLVVYAAQRAQKAADLIMGRQPSKKAGDDSEAAQGATECQAA